MNFQSNPYLIWQILPGLLMFGLALYILTRPLQRRESKSLAALLFGGMIWSLANGLQWTSPDEQWQVFWNSFTYIGILVVPTAWFFLAARFTGYFSDLVDRLRPLLVILPILTFAAILTNPLHFLFFESLKPVEFAGFVSLSIEWGPIFFLHTYYSYLLTGGGMALLVYALFTNFRKYGVHTYGLLFGALTPLIGNVFYLFGSFPPGFPDPTPILFMVTGVTFAWAIIGSRMFETIPLAHSSIVKSLATGILVLDAEKNVLDVNASAVTRLQLSPHAVVGNNLTNLFDANHPVRNILKKVETNPGEDQRVKFEIPESGLTLEAVAAQLQDNFGDVSGYLIQLKDISQLSQVEEDLATTQETFDTVLDTLQDSFYEASPEGYVLNANLAFVRTLGYEKKEDVIGRHFRTFTDRRQVREIFAKFQQLYEAKKAPEPFLYDYRTKQGDVYHGETVVVPIMDGDEIVGARGLVRNVTDRVRAEREVAEQKEFLDGLLQNAPFAIAITNLENEITVVNPAFESLFEYSQHEVVNEKLSELLTPKEMQGNMQALKERMQTEEVYLATKRKKKTGDIVDVEVFSAPYFLRNEKFGTLVFYNDISERIKAEADLDRTESTYREVLDTFKDPYVEADPSGRIVYGNQAFVDAVTRTSKEQIIGMHFRRVIPRGTVRAFVSHFQEVYRTRLPVGPFETRFLNRAGRELIAEWSVAPIMEDGEVVGMRGIAREVTERIESERRLREAKDAAETRAGELSAINRVAEQVGESLDLDEILETVCRELTRIFNVRNAGIGLLDNAETHLEIRAFHSVDPGEESALGLKLPLEGNAASQEVVDTKKTLVISNAQEDPRTSAVQEISRQRGTKTIMIVPLLARGKVIGTIGMPAKDDDYEFGQEEIELAGTIASQIASAVDNAKLYAQTEMALGAAESDLEIGSQIQSGFFPDTMPSIEGWEIATHFHSARQVAGDFYDIFQFEDCNHTAFVVADVCDKGVGAALFMVLFRSLIRAFSNIKIEPERVREQLQEIIMKTNNYVADIHGNSSMFATVFFGILDPESNMLYYVNGGHEPPAILDKDGDIKSRLMPTGPAVGLFPDLPFEIESLYLAPGDILVGFTDGTTDARNDKGELFTEERLLESVQAPWTSIFSMIYELQIGLRNHIGEQVQFDDITLVSLRRKLSEEIDYHAICRPAEMHLFTEMREFVETAATHNGLPQEDIFAFKLAAEEILTNVIQYGYRGRQPGLIAIAFVSDQEKAVLKIWDDGAHFSPDDAAEPDLELGWEERQIGGLGVFFVKELMDKITYTRENENTNLMVLEKNISKSQ